MVAGLRVSVAVGWMDAGTEGQRGRGARVEGLGICRCVKGLRGEKGRSKYIKG